MNNFNESILKSQFNNNNNNKLFKMNNSYKNYTTEQLVNLRLQNMGLEVKMTAQQIAVQEGITPKMAVRLLDKCYNKCLMPKMKPTAEEKQWASTANDEQCITLDGESIDHPTKGTKRTVNAVTENCNTETTNNSFNVGQQQ
jgi:antitoxin component of RelBE/YafQ-DinJ toxin-antitoxin module